MYTYFSSGLKYISKKRTINDDRRYSLSNAIIWVTHYIFEYKIRLIFCREKVGLHKIECNGTIKPIKCSTNQFQCCCCDLNWRGRWLDHLQQVNIDTKLKDCLMLTHPTGSHLLGGVVSRYFPASVSAQTDRQCKKHGFSCNA